MRTKPVPYQLMWVKHLSESAEQGSYTYLGEVMSYPIPKRGVTATDLEDTVMVRRVPGHPGTLEEVYLAQLKAIDGARGKPAFKYVSYASVGGVGQFPVDMLRYDHCAPVNFKLVADRWGALTKPEIDPAFGFEELLVAKACTRQGNSEYIWTPERWGSFMWGLKLLKTIPIQDDATLSLR